MDPKVKKVLIVNLSNKTYEVKSFGDLNRYVGGVGLGLKLMEIYKEADPLVISIGPLNGFFPFASKTAIIVNDAGPTEDIYLGGNISLRIRYAGLDAIVITGKSNEETIIDIINNKVSFKDKLTPIETLGLPGKKSVISYEKEFLLNGYFTTAGDYLERSLIKKNIVGIVITGTEIYSPKDFERYEYLYNKIVSRANELSVLPGEYPSCSNCPLGCGKSKRGEIGGNVLIHSLVACQYADKIYSDVGIVFSCLNALGYEYTHEDLENLPVLIEEVIKNL